MAIKTIKKIVPYVSTTPSFYGFDGTGVIDVEYTFITRFKAPEDYYGFEVCYPNFGANQTVILGSTWGTVPSLLGSYSQTNPQAILVNDVNIANTTLSSGSISKPSVLTSDLVNVPGVAGNIIEVRYRIGALAGNVYAAMASTNDALPSGMTELVTTGGRTGDYVTGNQAANPDPAGTYFTNMFIKFFSKNKKITVLHCGDSLCRGSCGSLDGNSVDGKYSPLWLASRIDNRISPYTLGRNGDNCRRFSLRALEAAKILKPSIVILPPFSPNDSSNLWNGYFGQVLATASNLREIGILPILTTPIPWDYSGADLTAWQLIRSEVLRISDEWKTPCIDFSSVLEDPAVPGKLLDMYYSAGSSAAIRLHPNQVGKLAEANEIARVIGLIAT